MSVKGRFFRIGKPQVLVVLVLLGVATCGVVGRIDGNSRKFHRRGVEYMKGLDDEEIEQVVAFSEHLMEIAPIGASWSVMGKHSNEEVPSRWANLGVRGIRYGTERVTFYFAGGGPAPRTLMVVHKDSAGELTITGTFWDVEQDPPLYTTKERQQKAFSKADSHLSDS